MTKLASMAMLIMAAGLFTPVCAASVPQSAHMSAHAVSAASSDDSGGRDAGQWLPLEFPEPSPFSTDRARLLPLSTVGAVFNPADGVGVYAGLNFDLSDVFNGYAMGVPATLPAADTAGYLFGNDDAYAGVQMMLADGIRFNFGQAFARNYSRHADPAFRGQPNFAHDADSTATLVSGLSWNFARWGGFRLSAAQTRVRDAALGNAASAMDLARMASLGVSAHVGFGDGWVTSVSYSQASLKLSLNPGFENGAPVQHRQSFGIAVAKQGLFGNDALGLSLTRPSGNFATAPHLPKDMQFQFYGRDKLFSGKASQETDIGLGYVTSFLDGPIALQANASYQLNALGQDKDSLTFMSRAKIKF